MTEFFYPQLYNVIKAGEKMVVYADILILINFIVDYFLLRLSSRFLHKKPRLWRMLTGSAMGGLFSLYIFLPQSNFLFQSVVQLLMCMALCLMTFGFGDMKTFGRSVAVLFVVNFAYSGAMIAIWMLFKPHGMVINNSVVYLDISPLFFIVFSVIGYFCVVLLRKILRKNFPENIYCDVIINNDMQSIKLSGIVDSGNSLTDVFGLSQIFITDENTVNMLLSNEKHNPARLRKIPCSTVAGKRLLDGYRIDNTVVLYNGKKYDFKNPVLAISATPLSDCKIIVNPETLN